VKRVRNRTLFFAWVVDGESRALPALADCHQGTCSRRAEADQCSRSGRRHRKPGRLRGERIRPPRPGRGHRRGARAARRGADRIGPAVARRRQPPPGHLGRRRLSAAIAAHPRTAGRIVRGRGPRRTVATADCHHRQPQSDRWRPGPCPFLRRGVLPRGHDRDQRNGQRHRFRRALGRAGSRREDGRGDRHGARPGLSGQQRRAGTENRRPSASIFPPGIASSPG
jgi:hypothetical protein